MKWVLLLFWTHLGEKVDLSRVPLDISLAAEWATLAKLLSLMKRKLDLFNLRT